MVGKILFSTVLLAVILSACAGGQNLPTPPEGMAALAGCDPAAATRWSAGEVLVWAAPYFGTPDGEGLYMLEPNQHAHTPLEADGSFFFPQLEPGSYVLVIGPTPEEARPVLGRDGRVQVFNLQSGQALDAGKVELAP